jgi:hypothetical protein
MRLADYGEPYRIRKDALVSCTVLCGMISQQCFGSSDLPFPSAKAKNAPLEHTTLPAMALFSSQFLSMLSH